MLHRRALPIALAALLGSRVALAEDSPAAPPSTSATGPVQAAPPAASASPESTPPAGTQASEASPSPSMAPAQDLTASAQPPPPSFTPPPQASPQYPMRLVEPWSDADPPSPRVRHPMGDFGVRAAIEYRAQLLHINNLSPTTETARNLEWLEHRLRADAALDYRDKVKVVFSADALDGTLWGDNGSLFGGPTPNSGANISARAPNSAAPCVTYAAGDPLAASSYTYGLCASNAVNVRHAYGEVALPVGVLRVGRMNVNEGVGVQAADSDGRPNRFGISRAGSSVDRVLFATKPLEGFKSAAARDTSAERGVFLGILYDRLVTDSPQAFGDDVQQAAASVRLLAPKHALGSDLHANVFVVHRWSQGSQINGVGTRVYSTFGPFRAGFDAAFNTGTTREISQAYQKITNDPPADQSILQGGFRGVFRYDRKLFSLYLESDYASGSDDPRSRATLSQFLWAEDANVGLLLFKHVMAFQTARAAAAGTELLHRLGASQFPTTSIDTKGALTNAFTIFPQADFRPHKDILFRAGVLFAWTAVPLIDPIASLQARSSVDFHDDLVNFAGGKPGGYYGTELDGRFQWRFQDHFIFDAEAAVLFPGSALLNRDGYAVRSYLGQARTTFFF